MPVAQTCRSPATTLSRVLRCPYQVPVVGCGEIQVSVSPSNFGPATGQIPSLYRALILILIVLAFTRLLCQVNSLRMRAML